ncbi:hypothetical protein [Pseudomonas sp. Teo4]|uniref:fimbrial protein n=1 Tax=Pseudomonas sp. Teo4 TaxID=3064528 RepID=UPI002ABC9064|nr:hypothetical protein [Pseudomonas sp. Teo4]MDZ3990533.1 hypothetical protein [Pseudomonas sp. Teo4]
MKKKLATAGLALGLSGAAFANTGSIQFYGQITSGTCSIEIIDPALGTKLDRIPLGNVANHRFAGVGDESNSRPFAMRVRRWWLPKHPASN